MVAGLLSQRPAGIMIDMEQASPTNLLDQLADLDPQEKREVATILRQLSADLR